MHTPPSGVSVCCRLHLFLFSCMTHDRLGCLKWKMYVGLGVRVHKMQSIWVRGLGGEGFFCGVRVLPRIETIHKMYTGTVNPCK